ncbi:hypothetical protein MMPV_007839 [Pyropia vietnamensis]
MAQPSRSNGTAGPLGEHRGNHEVSYGSFDNSGGGVGSLTRRRSTHAVPNRVPSTTWRSARDAAHDGCDAVTPTNSMRRRGSAISDSALGAYAASMERKVDLQLHERHAGMVEALEGYNSPMNALLVFVPLGIAAGLLDWSQTLVFLFNFLGVIPLAMILGRATEDIAAHTNQTIGGLINATFGNAVELILSFSALKQGKLDVIRDTLVGSVLSNLLLVLGASFFFGGLVYREQEVLAAVAEANGDLLSFSMFGFVLPAIFSLALMSNTTIGETKRELVEARFSLFTAVVLLAMYILYLVFQLYTHAELYAEVEEEANPDVEAGGSAPDGPIGDAAAAVSSPLEPDSSASEAVASLPMASAILVCAVVVVSICSEFVVGSIEGFSRAAGLGESFIALVLLPIIGNAVEHWAAVVTAVKDKMDLSIGIACGSSVQIALFVAPVMVIVSWFAGAARLTLNFHLFETVCLVMSVQVVTMTMRDSRTNWLEGSVLLCCYLIIASAFFFMG